MSNTSRSYENFQIRMPTNEEGHKYLCWSWDNYYNKFYLPEGPGGHIIRRDSIVHVDLDAPNGGCDNSVLIETENGKEFYFNWEIADQMREFLKNNF